MSKPTRSDNSKFLGGRETVKHCVGQEKRLREPACKQRWIGCDHVP